MVKIYEVVPRLFMRGEVRGLKWQNKVRLVKDNGLDVIICLLQTADPELGSSDLVDYRQRPLPDAQVVPEERARSIAEEVVDEIIDGRSVLVHCIAGRNRSGLVAGLAARELLACDGERAFQVLKRARPSALTNEVYESFLRGLPIP